MNWVAGLKKKLDFSESNWFVDSTLEPYKYFSYFKTKLSISKKSIQGKHDELNKTTCLCLKLLASPHGEVISNDFKIRQFECTSWE